MANNRNASNHSRAPQKRRRRPSGVPVMLVVVLLIIALLMGALAGYVVARRTDTHIHELQSANDRITELENTLTLIGYPVDDDVDPQQWQYDNTANESALADLTGESWEDDDEDDLWADNSLIDATLPEDADPVVVAEFEGGQLLSSEVIPEYNDQLTTQIFAGHSADEVAEETLNSVLRNLVADKLIAQQAAELGLTELTDDDLEAIGRQAEENYEAQLRDYMVLEGEEDRESAAKRLEEDSGVTLKSVTEALKQTWWAQKYYDYVVRDVAVTDEEVQAHYDALLAQQRQTFTDFPEDFEYAHLSGQLIVYNPEGYRAARDILIPFDAQGLEQVAELTEQMEQGTAPEDAQQQLDALYAPLETRAQEAQDKLNDGQSFAELMDEYGCSEALKAEPLRSEGFYLSGSSFVNSVEFVEGAMMLEQPGQVSAPLRSPAGVHLVEYIGDVPAGEVPLADAMDTVRADALREKQAEYYQQQREALLEAAEVQYYPERLR